MNQHTLVRIAEPRAVPSQDLLQRMDRPGPRYTSYPTADRFTEDFDADAFRRVLAERRLRDEQGLATPLSVYVHVPFCESVCYYCACNKIITRHHERAEPYLDALGREIDLVTAEIGAQRTVAQVHLGGGSPTFLSDDELSELMTLLRWAFFVQPDAEISIEVDPRTVTHARLAHLRALGFNRISFGIQDFDPAVQQAVHRIQPFESVRDLMAQARGLGFKSINADLIYGLPCQTPASFARTIAQVGELRPDRIALYAYAHLPERFKPQRRIHAADLPSPVARTEMLATAMAGFVARGYDYIGMDHFALPDDPLAIARRQGKLHRNFQGYSTHADCDLVGLGVSAIGRIGDSYYQNAKTLPEYDAALAAGCLPVVRGLTLDDDDRVRRDIIMALMCHGRVDFRHIEKAHQVRMRDAFARELLSLQPLAADSLVVLTDDAIEVTAAGWYIVRAIALVFDRYLRDGTSQGRFSRIV
ncbi:MAG: oxygen-independent coproporphyrinogen III oxidase [Vitreoscilla sp.]